MKALMILTTAMTSVSAYANLITHPEAHDRRPLVADSFQKTLYIFDPDLGAAAPQCNGDCAEVWPPYIVSAKEAQELQAPLGTVARVNNKLQLTYAGRPVYTYIFDRAIGDIRGDGLGNVWHLVELK